MLTPQNAAAYLPIIQAMAEGKTVQFQNRDGVWSDAPTLVLCEPPEVYRVKPLPREWLIKCSLDGTLHVDIGGLAAPRGETIRVREILD